MPRDQPELPSPFRRTCVQAVPRTTPGGPPLPPASPRTAFCPGRSVRTSVPGGLQSSGLPPSCVPRPALQLAVRDSTGAGQAVRFPPPPSGLPAHHAVARLKASSLEDPTANLHAHGVLAPWSPFLGGSEPRSLLPPGMPPPTPFPTFPKCTQEQVRVLTSARSFAWLGPGNADNLDRVWGALEEKNKTKQNCVNLRGGSYA